MRPTTAQQPRFWTVLVTLQGFISLSALAGGAGLMFSPGGKALSMPLELLKGSPFDDFLLPGIFLFTIIGLGHGWGMVLSLRRHPFYASLAVVLSVILVLWITLQVYWIGLVSILQPVYLLMGLVEFTLGFLLLRLSTRD